MKYTNLIVSFLLLNLFLVFSMIYIANKTREIEKENHNIKIKISKITEDVKINKIELITHQNESFLKKLHNLYYNQSEDNNISNILSIDQFMKRDQNLKLVNSNN